MTLSCAECGRTITVGAELAEHVRSALAQVEERRKARLPISAIAPTLEAYETAQFIAEEAAAASIGLCTDCWKQQGVAGAA